MKKKNKLLLILLLLLFVLTGCGQGIEIIDLHLKEVVDLDMPTHSSEEYQTYEAVEEEFVSPLYTVYYFSSGQELNYFVYAPEGVSEETPLFLFLHGDGDMGKTPEEVMARYQFLRALAKGFWRPDIVVVMPIGRTPDNWHNEVDNIDVILHEVVDNYGGSFDNMYISGASAGADGLNSVAKNYNFKGVIYMAGHINGGGLNCDGVLSLWQGKPIYYYRDNLLTNGGYGYDPDLISALYKKAGDYNATFTAEDLDWNHTVGLVDATFLPETFVDANGNPCHNGIFRLIFGE